MEFCEGEALVDPEFLPECDCGETCKHASISNRVSENLPEVSVS